MPKLLYICEEYVPPVHDGSTGVYWACLNALKDKFQLYAVMFGDTASVGFETKAELAQLCEAYLILPEVWRNPALQLVKTLSRLLTGQLSAPRYLEEFGRGEVKTQITSFVRTHMPDAVYIHKSSCINRVGVSVIANFGGVKIIDLHDDFVARQGKERTTLKSLMSMYPALKQNSSYSRIRLKHRLSRFSTSASRRQEIEQLSLFDWIISASNYEAKLYEGYFPNRVVHCPWPISSTLRLVIDGSKKYSTGLIASAAVFNLEGLMVFVETQLPLIRRRDPEFTFLVAGGICDIFKFLCPGHKALGIAVMGRVNDVNEFYRSVSSVVVPLVNGTGVSLKTLEALACGIPVISTPLGVRGISPHDLVDRDVSVGELPTFHEVFARRSGKRSRSSRSANSGALSNYVQTVAQIAKGTPSAAAG